MANYYTHISFMFKATADEAAMFEDYANRDWGEPQQDIPESQNDIFGDVEIKDLPLGVDVVVSTAHTPYNRFIYVFDTDGQPNIARVAKLIQHCCPSSLPMGFTFAETCDKPRPNAFSGGAWAVFKDRIECECAVSTLDQMLAG